ncbi:hypothetical protein LTR70_005679 [Exophiala xenobiotica]|uniref:MARVEL domain-containing protein n=1 Tax=Lithohypha guttulata TaxID=1690604 RepID=A0ABR0KD01_9EURO|nr:hypothetical protein LTR24_004062 [Lithohypha guttulata]KAK5317674.1 hypothetical protein LTR70_005679 [Exophiala xenobiotica]
MLGNQGALGATFILSRYAQAASMIAIIGMTSNFIAEMVSASMTPSEVLVGTLSVVCIAVLYCAITVILFLDGLLPYLINAIIDSLFLIALIVVSVVVGKPLSYLQCTVIGDLNSSASSAMSFASALSNSLANEGGRINYGNWIGTNKSTCLQMKSIWGLSVALCILFFLSGVSTVCLWKRAKSGAAPEKGEA